MINKQRQFALDGGALAPVEHEELGLLPSWDLGDLYASVDDPAIERDVASAQAAAKAFAQDYRGNLAGLDAAGILGAINKLEAIYGQLGKVISFAQLKTATDKLDAKLAGFEQNMMERYASIAGELCSLISSSTPSTRLCRSLAKRPRRCALRWLVPPYSRQQAVSVERRA